MPLAGHDEYDDEDYPTRRKFLLPCPSRGMTKYLLYLFSYIINNFYSHAPRGA